jgi:hypothetical protein
VFLNSADDDDVRSVVSLLAKKAKEHESFRAFVYFLDGRPEQLKKLNDELQANSIALALIPDSDLDETLELYDINTKAKSTVLVYKDREVTYKVVNYNEKDADQVMKAIDKICD